MGILSRSRQHEVAHRIARRERRAEAKFGMESTPEENTSRFHALVKSYRNFDNLEIFEVISSQLKLTPEEECYVATYYRVRGNVETMVEITHAKHFQSAAMLARAVFELGVDMMLLEKTTDGCIKMLAFSDVERLRSARNVVAFKAAHPDADIDLTTYTAFITKDEKRLDALKLSIWPKGANKYHWSGLGLDKRIAHLNSPVMDRIYVVDYPRLSWYVHSGVTGILNLKAEAFVHLCANAFWVAAVSYRESLEVIIRKFRIRKAVNKLDDKLDAAKLFPFNDDPEIEDWLKRSIQS
jgi:hypothetical protein